MEDDRGVRSLHACSLDEVRVVGESVEVGPYRGFVLVEFGSDGRKFLVEHGEHLSEEVCVSVEGPVVLVDVNSRVWIGVSNLVFDCGHGSVHSQEKMRLDMGHPLFME